jgi:hypothetical protein
MISKYSVFVVGTRLIYSIFMLKKFSVPLTSESVTSGQAGGVFRQLFSQCILKYWNIKDTVGLANYRNYRAIKYQNCIGPQAIELTDIQ